MILDFSRATTIWELLAGTLLGQQSQNCSFFSEHKKAYWLLPRFGLTPADEKNGAVDLRFDFAYEPKMLPNPDISYVEGLARCSGVSYPTTMPLLMVPEGSCHAGKHIVLAYGAVHGDFVLPVPVWRAILRMARTYASKIYLVGTGERPDVALMESECLVDERLAAEKWNIVSEAALVIGPPNDWTWLATAWRKPIVVLYADSQPMRKWFPFGHDKFGRMLYNKDRLNVTQMLADLR